jgi:hypothetical protein
MSIRVRGIDEFGGEYACVVFAGDRMVIVSEVSIEAHSEAQHCFRVYGNGESRSTQSIREALTWLNEGESNAS